jgi:methylmalonyl-CoA mutase
MKTERFALASGFAPASRQDWHKLVDGVLKGAPFEKLIGRTYDDLRIEPIYLRAKDIALVDGRAPAAPWQIMQRIDHPDAVTANRQALHDLENGATGLTLVFAGANCSGGFGLDQTAGAVAKALKDVHLDAGIGIELQIGTDGRKTAIHIAEYVKSVGLDPAVCDIRFGLDPLGACALSGRSPYTWEEIARTVASTIKGLVTLGFKGPFAASDGRIVHDAGGSEVQELAFVLACGVAYLHAMEAARIPLDQARSMIYARLTAVLAGAFEVGLHLRFEPGPVLFQIRFRARPSGLAGFRLRLEQHLKFISPSLQIRDDLIGFHLGLGFDLRRFHLERSQCGIHLVDAFLGPIEVKMHAALLGHDHLR